MTPESIMRLAYCSVLFIGAILVFAVWFFSDPPKKR